MRVPVGAPRTRSTLPPMLQQQGLHGAGVLPAFAMGHSTPAHMRFPCGSLLLGGSAALGPPLAQGQLAAWRLTRARVRGCRSRLRRCFG